MFLLGRIYRTAQTAQTPCADMRASALVAPDSRVFDRTALLTVRCRHGILLSFADLKTGERFAYGMAAVAHLRATGLPITTVWYDVGDGRFFSAMSRFPELRGVRPVLPAMHARMHTVACRVRWEGAAAPGVGDPVSELSEHKNRALALVCLGRTREAG